MGDFIATLTMALFGGWVTIIATRRLTRSEGRLIQMGWLAHVATVFVQLWLALEYYGGDMIGYWHYGMMLASMLRHDFWTVLPEVGRAILHMNVEIPIPLHPGGGSTRALSAIAGLLMFVLNDSLYAAVMAVSMAAFSTKLLLYRVFRESFDVSLHKRLLVAVVLVPSVVFWSSALLKESITMVGIGLMTYGVHRVFGGRVLLGLALATAGVGVVGVLKAYTLFPFALAAGVWFYWLHTTRRGVVVAIKPIYLAMGLALAIGGVVGLGRIFPEYSIDQVTDNAATLQERGASVDGGSNYLLVTSTERDLISQVAFAPAALGTVLFRPLIFEAKNATMAINALETGFLLILLMVAISRKGLRGIKKELWSSPLLMFSLVFTLTFGTAIGLATTNMGTLSRYRIPLMPFFVAALVVVHARSGRRTQTVPLSVARAVT